MTGGRHGGAAWLALLAASWVPQAAVVADGLAWLAAPQLRRGDTIAFVAPAGVAAERDVLAYRDVLQREGYRVQIAPGMFARRQRYLAGSDAERADELNRAIRDPQVRAILAVRGGYGLSRILDRIDYDALRSDPKIVGGYSDLTALHLAIARRTRMISFHCPMPAEWGRDPEGRAFASRSFAATVLRPQTAVPFAVGMPPGARPRTLTPGCHEGRLLGGNLSLICATLGTPFAIEPEGAILFIEDVDEKPYRVDRMLAHLRLAGVLESVGGVIVGQFTIDDPDERREIAGVVSEYLAPLGCPVLTDFPVGHVADNVTLPHGARVRLDADRGTLEILEPVLDGPR